MRKKDIRKSRRKWNNNNIRGYYSWNKHRKGLHHNKSLERNNKRRNNASTKNNKSRNNKHKSVPMRNKGKSLTKNGESR